MEMEFLRFSFCWLEFVLFLFWKKLSQTRVLVLTPAGEWITEIVSKQNKKCGNRKKISQLLNYFTWKVEMSSVLNKTGNQKIILWLKRLLERSKWDKGRWNLQKIMNLSLQFIEFSISGKTCTFFGNIHAKYWILALPVWAKVYSPCAALGAAWHSIVLR